MAKVKEPIIKYSAASNNTKAKMPKGIAPLHQLKIIIEKHEDGYVGYPLGFTRGAIVGQGDTYAEALKDTESAIVFFIEYYGKKKIIEHIDESSSLDVYIAEAAFAV